MSNYRSRRYQELGIRLRNARRRSGLTLEQVAERIGVRMQMVWYWEAGRSMPRGDRMGKLAHLYGVSVDWLLGEEGNDGRGDELMYGEPERALRAAYPDLIAEDREAIASFIRWTHEQRRKARQHREEPSDTEQGQDAGGDASADAPAGSHRTGEGNPTEPEPPN